jgi:hypothetical protein
LPDSSAATAATAAAAPAVLLSTTARGVDGLGFAIQRCGSSSSSSGQGWIIRLPVGLIAGTARDALAILGHLLSNGCCFFFLFFFFFRVDSGGNVMYYRRDLSVRLCGRIGKKEEEEEVGRRGAGCERVSE